MPRQVRITDRDKGFKKLLRNVSKAARGRGVTVGVHSGEGGAPAAGGGTVADVASIHEFGLGQEERSFIRAWADQDEADHRDVERRFAESIVKGRNTVDEALEKMGLHLASEAQKFLSDGRVSPDISQATKDKKGSSTPLVDKSQLKNSIMHKVES